MTITPEKLRVACAEFRDLLTDGTDAQRAAGETITTPRIYPLALDVIATTPTLLVLLAQRLSR